MTLHLSKKAKKIHTDLIWLVFTQSTNTLEPSFSIAPINPLMQSLHLIVTLGSFSNHCRASQRAKKEDSNVRLKQDKKKKKHQLSESKKSTRN